MSGKTTLWSPPVGDVGFPITPTSMDGMTIGASVPESGTFTTVSATVVAAATVTASVGAFGTISVQTPILPSGIAAVNPTVSAAATTDTFAAAVALTAAINVVVTAAFASGSPVALPSVASFLGSKIAVFNQTTHTVAVWPQPGDGLDVLGTTVAALLDAGKRAEFFGIAPANGTTALGSIISAQLGVTSV